MSEITEITVESYHVNPTHKALGDELMAAAGVNPDDCFCIRRDGADWVFSVYKRGSDGKIRLDFFNREASIREVRWTS